MISGVRRRTIAALFAEVTGCGAAGISLDGVHAPVPSGPVSVDTVTLADDRLSVRVDFIGGQEFDPDNPCSVAYEGTAEIVGDELEIGIFAQQHPKTLPEDWACELMGYPRTLVLDLSEPFKGTRVRDLAGQLILLEPPDDLAQISGLPDGWELRREESLGESTTPRWMRVYSPIDDPWPSEGDSMVTLIQAFDGPVNTTGAEIQPPVEVNGAPATLYLHPPTGEMVVVWSLGMGELALAGYLSDFTQEEFIALAESVALPGQ